MTMDEWSSIDWPLIVSLVECLLADLSHDPHTAADDCCLGLGPAHASQARGHEDTPPQVTRPKVVTACIQDRQLHRCGEQ